MHARFSAGRILLATGALTMFAALSVLVASALPPRESFAASNCTYYSDASRTTVVGQYGYDCCNNKVAWGRKTAYSVCGGCFPCTPPPR